MKRLIIVAAVLVPSLGHAETLYVTDRLLVGLRASVVEGSPVVRNLETGTALDVLERFENTVHVRDRQGTEGWIDARYLSPEPPARLRVRELEDRVNTAQGQLAATRRRLEDELSKTRAELEAARKKLERTEAALAQASEKRDILAARLQETDVAARPVPVPVPAENDASRAPRDAGQIPTGADGGADWNFSFLWLAVSFAMLVVGFVAGVVWVRESIRRRMGGMYLRV